MCFHSCCPIDQCFQQHSSLCFEQIFYILLCFIHDIIFLFLRIFRIFPAFTLQYQRQNSCKYYNIKYLQRNRTECLLFWTFIEFFILMWSLSLAEMTPAFQVWTRAFRFVFPKCPWLPPICWISIKIGLFIEQFTGWSCEISKISPPMFNRSITEVPLSALFVSISF